jgi:hypothetical protein
MGAQRFLWVRALLDEPSTCRAYEGLLGHVGWIVFHLGSGLQDADRIFV